MCFVHPEQKIFVAQVKKQVKKLLLLKYGLVEPFRRIIYDTISHLVSSGSDPNLAMCTDTLYYSWGGGVKFHITEIQIA